MDELKETGLPRWTPADERRGGPEDTRGFKEDLREVPDDAWVVPENLRFVPEDPRDFLNGGAEHLLGVAMFCLAGEPFEWSLLVAELAREVPAEKLKTVDISSWTKRRVNDFCTTLLAVV